MHGLTVPESAWLLIEDHMLGLTGIGRIECATHGAGCQMRTPKCEIQSVQSPQRPDSEEDKRVNG